MIQVSKIALFLLKKTSIEKALLNKIAFKCHFLKLIKHAKQGLQKIVKFGTLSELVGFMVVLEILKRV